MANRFVLLGVVLVFAVAGNARGQVRAGVAACEITPDVQKYQVPLAGYGARGGKPAIGVHDALMAKVLYFESGVTRMAIVTTDLRSMTPELKNQVIRKAEGSGLTRENLLICASHTHDGPAIYAEKFWQLQFGTYDPAIVEAMSERIAGAIREARAGLFDARVGTGEAMLDEFTHNRRWEYDQAARKAAGETPQTNPRLFVLRVDDAAGKTRAVLVNFATHPTILDADNFLVSAEWPGVMQRRVESDFPGAVAMFANGAEGDQSPAGAQGADAFAQVEDFGTRLAARAREVARGITTAADFTIAFAHADAPLGEPSFSEGSKKGRYAFMEPMAMEALPRAAEVQVLRVGTTAFVGVPGEPICEVGRAVEEAVRSAGIPQAIIVSLSNDYIGYILNAKEYAHGGYEVDQRSYYGPTLGERIAAAAGDVARLAK